MSLDKWHSQLRKGTLEFVILIFLEKKDYYGYELIRKIKDVLALDTTEGTVYPILNRLKKAELVTTKWVHQEVGIPRKYYSLSPNGIKVLKQMGNEWDVLSHSIDKIRGKL